MFCYTFAENVEIVYKKNKENPKLKEKRCKLLESLVSYNIHGNYISSLHANYNNMDKLTTVLEMIISETSNKSKDHICVKKLDKSFYSSEWTKIKDINDYGENYDFIRNKSSIDNKYNPNELLDTLKCKEKIKPIQEQSMTDQRDCDEYSQELLQSSMYNNNKPFGITDFGFFLLIRIRNGIWLFNRLKKKKILKDTLLGNYENEMLEDNYKHSDEDLSNITLHITYQTS
ncbi:hypothetical protein POVCU1_074550 [Plasmodium ovale curtisi]|uniref:PIR Superfamily Protein n=1 Tax=Plasmodium ovale curtisi TaxID=864141 RepID=A0A1A8XC16_PLAOA|nr:hypothetical protein POVCU1_074550 [Plasmodium ovale curtisi]